MSLKARLDHVEEEIERACDRAGRHREEITLVAVTKKVEVEVARELVSLGVHDLGENRPQELWRKAEALPESVRWHMIGSLQTNKVERTLPLVRMIHSVDRLKLLNVLEKEAKSTRRTIDVLLQVNASREERKHGFSPEEIPALVPRISELAHVRVKGLMTMAAWEEDAEKCRPTFALLRELGGRLGSELSMPMELSMGMSNDYPIAIEEGATLIRLGSTLFVE